MSDQRIGWLGTGRLGTAMATRLLEGGTTNLTVWNRTASKAAALVSTGAQQVDTIDDLTGCDIVFTTVMSSPDLLAVTLGPGGLLTGKTAPKVIVDCSTVSEDAAKEVRNAAAERGTAMLSAPVSGNASMVAAGRAAIVASGPDEAFEAARGYLESMAVSVVHCGPNEEAPLVKLCHNLLLGMITEALAEVVTLSEKGGVAPAVFLDFINGSVLASTFIGNKGEAIRSRDYAPTFTSKSLRKDFDLGLAAARALEVPLPLAAATHHLIQTAIGYGYGDDDYVTLYELAARAAGIERGEQGA
ncbi:NAD(P)-dependent oxidoreductase [Mycolicibacterium baixiangningiae]|uniref:NAD(P)-dependent oxidoreductase n=1 Tax=Mycolicibacterium baixiangningiae TaxID=2761578 RepID=UPI0018679C02|nr:NAD(P)-dependent oxidoreductase [Mycolicibacterium baixiangningiae]